MHAVTAPELIYHAGRRGEGALWGNGIRGILSHASGERRRILSINKHTSRHCVVWLGAAININVEMLGVTVLIIAEWNTTSVPTAVLTVILQDRGCALEWKYLCNSHSHENATGNGIAVPACGYANGNGIISTSENVHKWNEFKSKSKLLLLSSGLIRQIGSSTNTKYK